MVADSTVQDIHALRYNPKGFIEFMFGHPEEWQTLPIRINKTLTLLRPSQAGGLITQEIRKEEGSRSNTSKKKPGFSWPG